MKFTSLVPMATFQMLNGHIGLSYWTGQILKCPSSQSLLDSSLLNNSPMAVWQTQNSYSMFIFFFFARYKDPAKENIPILSFYRFSRKHLITSLKDKFWQALNTHPSCFLQVTLPSTTSAQCQSPPCQVQWPCLNSYLPYT